MNLLGDLFCPACYASGDATCQCGKPYLPPGKLAVKLVKKFPEKSSRALAAMAGIDEGTVRTARKTAAEYSAPEKKRTGRDGKAYRMPRRRVKVNGSGMTKAEAEQYKAEEKAALEVEVGNALTALVLRADYAFRFGKWADESIQFTNYTKGELHQALKFARCIVEVWNGLVTKMEEIKR